MNKKISRKIARVPAKSDRSKLTASETALIEAQKEWLKSDSVPVRFKSCGDGVYDVPEKTGNAEVDGSVFLAKLAKHYGTNDRRVALELATQLIAVARYTGRPEESVNTAIALVAQIEPKDAIEAMLVNQMVSVHLLAMESALRAVVKGQTFEWKQLHLREVNKLARTFTAQMEALNRHRGKGQQKMIVEHVHVNEGGQAVIGDVHAKGGVNGNRE